MYSSDAKINNLGDHGMGATFLLKHKFIGKTYFNLFSFEDNPYCFYSLDQSLIALFDFEKSLYVMMKKFG